MQNHKKLILKIAQRRSLSNLISKTKQQLVLPFYHTVSDIQLPHLKHLYAHKNVNAFKADLDTLLKHYEPISLDEIKNKSFSKPSFHLSFDDGLKECSTIIAPILLEKGIPATFFINSAFVDNKSLMHRYKASILIEDIYSDQTTKKIALLKSNIKTEDIKSKLLSLTYKDAQQIDDIANHIHFSFDQYLAEQQPYMNKVDIQYLQSNGFTIGSHSHDHPEFNRLNKKEQIEQALNGMLNLKKMEIEANPIFAFPFTDEGVSTKLFKEIKPMFDLTFGTAGLKPDPQENHFQRIPMEVENYSALELLKFEYEYYQLKKVLRKHQMSRK